MTALGPADIEEVLPLSPAQAGMLFDLLRGDACTDAYVGVARLSLAGPLDPDGLHAALEATVAAHGVLRASFVWEDVRQPMQVVHRAAALPFELVDLGSTGQAEAEAGIADRVLAERRRGFDPGIAPLMRATLFRLAPDRHVLVWAIHHLLADGWSMSVLADELLAHLAGERPRPGGRFRDFLAWHKRRGNAEDQPFWTSHLAGCDAPAPVTFGLPPARGEAHPLTGLHRVAVPTALDAGLQALARRLRVTTPVVLSTLWAMLLRRYGAGDDVIFGETDAGRPGAVTGVAHAVGPFVNTLPARIGIDPAEPISALIGKAGAAALDRRQHGFAALSDVQAWSGLPRGTPLFEASFVYEGLPAPGHAARDVTVTDMDVVGPASFPLSLLYHPGVAPAVSFYFDPRRHRAEDVARLGEEYLDLAQAVVAAPESPVGSLAAGLVVPTRPDPGAVPPFRPVHESFAAAACRDPDAPALADGTAVLGYGALLARARAIAGALIERGIGRGDIVPIALERGPGVIEAMLGVLISGAAYVPFDLAYPASRRQQILKVVTPRLVLAAGDGAGTVWEGLPCLDPGTCTAGPSEPLPEVAPEDPAYVLFTSGSQGLPKGVVVTHANLAFSTAVRTEVYGGDPAAFLVVSSLAFDSSVTGIYWALTTGGTLVISPPGATGDMDALSRLVEDTGTTHMLCLPALYRSLIEAAPPGRLEALRTAIVAGEPLPASLIAAHRRRLPGTRLFNEYGPTEATVWCTAYDTAMHDGGQDVPIGRPIPGVAVVITDPDGNPLPDGAAGEIMVLGPGIAAGYLGAPAGANRAFVAPSWAGAARAYRTGDHGLRRPDGTILYRGRRDDQVKIRGHRVEPAEVEAALRQHLPIGEAEVLALGSGDATRLVGFVEAGADFDPVAARATLDSTLPAYMVPASITNMAALPRLPNGKLDRQALQALAEDAAAAPGHPGDAPPASLVEATLARLWGKVLGLDAVPPSADFFALGGDSLRSIRLMSEARAAGLPMAPYELFDHPVLSDLARHLAAKAEMPVAGPGDNLLSIIRPDARDAPFFMIHGSPEMCSHLSHALGPDRPLGFQFSWYLTGEPPAGETLAAMVRALMPSLKALAPGGPYYLGGYSAGGVIAIELARMLRAEGAEVPLVFLLDPSWEMAPPERDRSPGAWLDCLIRRGRVAAAGLLAPLLSPGPDEAARLRRVQLHYRRALLRYRPARYDGPVIALISAEAEAHLGDTSWLARTCPSLRRETLPFAHLALQKDADGLFAWSSRLAQLLRECEHGRGEG